MVIGSILVILAIAELFLGAWFIFRYQRNQATLWYGLFILVVAVYVGGNGLGYLQTIPGQIAEHLAWTGGMLTAAFFLAFSYSFPVPQQSKSFLLILALWPVAVFVPGILWSEAFISQQGIVRFGEGYTTTMGPYFWFMILYFGVYFLWAITNLIRRLTTTDGIHRWQLRMILSGILLSLLISSIFDIYMPLASVTRFGYIGSLFTSIWFGYTGYILLKK